MDDKFKFAFLSGNTLKLIALATMTVDHVGAYIFPQLTVLRIIGRLAYPIFAFMIAEGCFYTRHKLRYFLEVFGIGVLCQVVYFIFQKSLHMNIMLVFAFSIVIVFSIQRAKEKRTTGSVILAVSLIAAAYFAAVIMPGFVKGFSFDYGFVGIVLPVIVYMMPGFKLKLAAFAGALIALAITMNAPIQYWALLTVPIMALYNGERGKLKMKQFFYVYYPAHMVVIWLIGEWM